MPERTLGPGTLKFGETGSQEEFAASVTRVIIEPSYSATDPIPVLSGAEIDGDDTETWQISGTIVQDYDLDNLIAWCLQNKGTLQPFVFIPNNDGEVQCVGTAKIRAIAIGGDVKKKNNSDFTFPMQGAPTYEAIDVTP